MGGKPPTPGSVGSDYLPGLTKLVEEMGELTQVLMKALALGPDHEFVDGARIDLRLIEELGDVHAALHFFMMQNIDYEKRADVHARRGDKLRKMEFWHHI